MRYNQCSSVVKEGREYDKKSFLVLLRPDDGSHCFCLRIAIEVTQNYEHDRRNQVSMLTITKTAATRLAEYMRENGQGKAVRIKLRSGG